MRRFCALTVGSGGFAERRRIANQVEQIVLNYSAIPASYPYRGTLEFDGAAVKALFQYGYDCASAGRLWTTFGHSSAAENRAREALVAGDSKCPADDQFIAHFAQSQR
jgi:hypothetical protein